MLRAFESQGGIGFPAQTIQQLLLNEQKNYKTVKASCCFTMPARKGKRLGVFTNNRVLNKYQAFLATALSLFLRKLHLQQTEAV